jgi:hypothetical protein
MSVLPMPIFVNLEYLDSLYLLVLAVLDVSNTGTQIHLLV